jgi:hypothetical protein
MKLKLMGIPLACIAISCGGGGSNLGSGWVTQAGS